MRYVTSFQGVYGLHFQVQDMLSNYFQVVCRDSCRSLIDSIKVGGGLSTNFIEHKMLAIYVSWVFCLCAVEDVLHHFREQFIKHMDTKAVLHELKFQCIISDGVMSQVEATWSPQQQNEILHDHLLKASTTKSLITTCDIISQVEGNPKMRALGEEMKNELEIGKCVYVGLQFFAP